MARTIPGRLLEVSSDGKFVVDCPLKPDTENVPMQTRMARKLSNGNDLAPHLLAFAIKVYTPDGKVVRVIKTDLEELGKKGTQLALHCGHAR